MSGSPATLTPPELAKRWRCKPSKILAFIRRGELRAFNLASNLSGRPRWRVPLDAILEFEQRRAAQPPTPARRRRTDRLPEGFVRYFS